MRIINRPRIYCIAENNRTNKQEKLILLIWGYNTTCISNNHKYNGRPIWSYLVFKNTSCEINICHSQSTGCEGDLALKSVTSLLARTAWLIWLVRQVSPSSLNAPSVPAWSWVCRWRGWPSPLEDGSLVPGIWIAMLHC